MHRLICPNDCLMVNWDIKEVARSNRLLIRAAIKHVRFIADCSI